MMTFVAAATLAPVTKPLPVIAVFEFIFQDRMRVSLKCLYSTLRIPIEVTSIVVSSPGCEILEC